MTETTWKTPQYAHEVPVLVDNGHCYSREQRRLMIQSRLSTQTDRANEVLSHVPSCGSKIGLYHYTSPGEGDSPCVSHTTAGASGHGAGVGSHTVADHTTALTSHSDSLWLRTEARARGRVSIHAGYHACTPPENPTGSRRDTAHDAPRTHQSPQDAAILPRLPRGRDTPAPVAREAQGAV